MNIKDKMKLSMFESSLPNKKIDALVAMCESAVTVEDLDKVQEVFERTLSESEIGELSFLKYFSDELKSSEFKKELAPIIDSTDEIFKYAKEEFEKDGVDPDEIFMVYITMCDRLYKESTKLSLQAELEYQKAASKANAKSIETDMEENKKAIEAAKAKKDAISSIENKVKSVVDKAKEKVKKITDKMKEKMKKDEPVKESVDDKIEALQKKLEEMKSNR